MIFFSCFSTTKITTKTKRYYSATMFTLNIVGQVGLSTKCRPIKEQFDPGSTLRQRCLNWPNTGLWVLSAIGFRIHITPIVNNTAVDSGKKEASSMLCLSS